MCAYIIILDPILKTSLKWLTVAMLLQETMINERLFRGSERERQRDRERELEQRFEQF